MHTIATHDEADDDEDDDIVEWSHGVVVLLAIGVCIARNIHVRMMTTTTMACMHTGRRC